MLYKTLVRMPLDREKLTRQIMNRLLLSLIIFSGLSLIGCQQIGKQDNEKRKIEFNQGLADELKTMTEIDQVAAYVPQGKYKLLTRVQWDKFKDSVFTTHKVRLEKIFDEFGYPGYDLVGKEGSNNFWLMVQHSDKDIDFQSRVLEKLKTEVDNNNADGSNYGLLTDRVKINKGEKQIYGTQVTYNVQGQAYPKPLVDSVNVNKRRAEVGLDPLEQYLNMMTLMHFEMNKDNLKARGITEPRLYKTTDSIVYKLKSE
jgi:hypothetical protein